MQIFLFLDTCPKLCKVLIYLLLLVTKLCPSLWPHELQHARLLCPHLSLIVCSNSSPLSQWGYLSHPLPLPSLFAFNLSQHHGLFQRVGSSHQVARVLELQLQHQSFQWIFRVDVFWDWLLWSPYCPRGSKEPYSAPQFKVSILWCSAFFMVQFSHLYVTF